MVHILAPLNVWGTMTENVEFTKSLRVPIRLLFGRQPVHKRLKAGKSLSDSVFVLILYPDTTRL